MVPVRDGPAVAPLELRGQRVEEELRRGQVAEDGGVCVSWDWIEWMA